MEKVTPQEALQRMSTAQLEGAQTGMRMAKGRSTIIVPEFISAMGSDFNISTIPNENSTLYFFNNGEGGLILPAYDEIAPVLGEAEKADFTLEIPPHVEAWFQCYAEEINATQIEEVEVVSSPDSPTVIRDSDQRVNIQPLIIATNWHQHAPYNAKLWYNNLEHYVGCPVIAAAQILQYWGTKGYYRGCAQSNSYSSSNCVVPAYGAAQVFDYPNLVNDMQTEAQKEAITYLFAKIGSAFQVTYDSDGTGLTAKQWGVKMKNCFKFNPALVPGNDYGSDTYIYAENNESNFNNKIYQNLVNGYPVAIATSVKLNNVNHGAHIFVCDGYRVSDGKFHMDFGFSDASYDGWFLLTAIETKGYNFNNTRWAWTDVIPIYKLGDAEIDDGNGNIISDGNVGIEDAVAIVNYINNPGSQTAGNNIRYDLTSNGNVNGMDLTYIINKLIKDADLRYATQ